MTPQEQNVEDLLIRLAAAPELAGTTSDGKSKREVFIGGFIDGVREKGVNVCTCPALDRAHVVRPACLRVFRVDAAGVASVQ